MRGTYCGSTSAGPGRRADARAARLGQKVLDLPYEVSDSDWLEQYIRATRVQTFLPRSRVAVSRHCQGHSGEGITLAELLENVETIAIGQRDVEENEVDRSCRRHFDRLRNGSRNVDIVPRFAKEDAERVGNEWTVLHDEDSRSHYWRGTLRGRVKKNRLPFPSSLSTQILP